MIFSAEEKKIKKVQIFEEKKVFIRLYIYVIIYQINSSLLFS